MENFDIDWSHNIAAIFRGNKKYLKVVKDVDLVDLNSLIAIDKQKQEICDNTEWFLSDQEANNALLWGARGTGKSSLIKGLLGKYQDDGLRIVEIPRNELRYLVDICDYLRNVDKKFIIFCDDLSFDRGDENYNALKGILEGSIEAPAKNILFYATSNRRHLMPEKMSDNLDARFDGRELHQSDAVEDQLSLSDRFGLILSFPSIDQSTYFDIVDSYFKDFTKDKKELHVQAASYATKRGVRSGRVAKQFFKIKRSLINEVISSF